MWGRAGQIVSTVIAVVLVHPASPMLPKAAFSPYFVSGRAFPALEEVAAPRDEPRPVQLRSTHAYVRLASARYVPPAARTAVIVGINNASGTPPLPGSVRDARHLYAALLGYGFRADNIQLLIEEQATRPAILSALRSMANRTPSTGIAVFAIATHTRRSGGTNSLATAEGARISAQELAAHIGAVRGRAWIALPTCYSAGYALPGIVGHNRIATFSSDANQQSYQVGDAGSFLFIHMVRRAMLEGRAPYSVESAFRFARDELAREHPDQVPSMNDGVAEDLVLGPSTFAMDARFRPRSGGGNSSEREDGDRSSYQTREASYSEPPSSEPPNTPRPRRGPAAVCGPLSYNCSR